jgi:hypothetical protein
MAVKNWTCKYSSCYKKFKEGSTEKTELEIMSKRRGACTFKQEGIFSEKL